MGPNTLIASFLQQAIDKEDNFNLQKTYERALKSIQAHPEILRNGSECSKLKYVGPKIASLIDRKLQQYQEQSLDSTRPSDLSFNFHDVPSAVSVSLGASEASTMPEAPKVSKPKRVVRPKKYIPSHRSGAYAILLALYKHSGSTDFMSKEEIMQHGQQYCNHSFRMFDPSHRLHTAWSSMKTLTEKDLVSVTSSRPLRYSLTDEGFELAQLLDQSLSNDVNGQGSTVGQSCSSDSSVQRTYSKASSGQSKKSKKSTLDEEEVSEMPTQRPTQMELPTQVSMLNTFYDSKRKMQLKKEQEALSNFSGDVRKLAKGSFDVLLVLDNREVRKRDDRDYFQLELEKQGVPVLTRQMELGDICWVVRSKTNHQDLFILDYIVERKKNDDLASSIKDNRFKEQKHRLGRCGISNLIYLVEEYDPCIFSPAAMTTALTETMICNDFFVKVTTNAEDTVRYLAKMTKFLVHQYKNSDIYVLDVNDIKQETHHALRMGLAKQGKPCLIPFSTFNSLNTKTKVISHRDLWQKQLLTIRGVSQEKARIISRQFPTFQSLISRLDECSTIDSKTKLFTDLKLGQALSQKIVNVFI